ncbi:MAG: beta-ketoacyl-ACP synthase II [Chloroherpetonaceae bacterium]|nr:beta-ketoacyl-ACP synthase II [Chloroherpetonaceae bacterium]MCS7211777.1 beta-ketoacyl-ACP synthase II [Chloroherpetonaceae bacterium]MDW8020466.1 beta-ketoacyl-ACP synthase II [Chloroherpetonaceae bacterium]MDW8465338.1 beta-ketoacyl-ACP synthase II [Chloroherpetonaceae bacterium]
MKPNRRRIAVTGIGVITPIGIGLQEFWDAMMAGKSGAGPITQYDASQTETKFACEVKGFDPHTYLDRKTVLRMDRYCQMGVSAAEMALADIRFESLNIDRTRVGVVFGTGIGGMITYDQQFRTFLQGGASRISPFFIPMMIPDIAAGHISIRHKLQGPNYATVSACATSLNAIIDAYMLIQMGYADMMICGGAEAVITPLAVAGFNAARALSTRNDDPEHASRPYDRDRDGFVMGEGAAALVLEAWELAEKRGAHIYAELAGVGMSADAYHLTAPHPEGTGAMLSMQRALEDAGIQPAQIEYINTHGTSTPLGDVAELLAIKKLFGEDIRGVSISSTKSMIGHLLGAAGAVESVACILALQHQCVPPTINIFNLDPAVDVDVTPNKPKPREINYVLNNGFGFGGHNCTVIFKKFTGK